MNRSAFTPKPHDAKSVVDHLNFLLCADAAAISSLFNYRVNCNDDIAHGTRAIVGIRDSEDGVGYVIGLLGVINAIVAPEVIGAIYQHGEITGFVVTDITNSAQGTHGGAK